MKTLELISEIEQIKSKIITAKSYEIAELIERYFQIKKLLSKFKDV